MISSRTLPQSINALYETGLIWNAEYSPVRAKIPAVSFLSTAQSTAHPSIPYGGLIKGAVHQVIHRTSFAPLIFAAQIAKQSIHQDGKIVFWIGKELWPAPHFLCDTDPSNLLFQYSLFVEHINEKKLIWAAEEALQSAATGVVIITLKKPTTLLLKRFAVKAKLHSTIFLIVQPHDNRAPFAATASTWNVQPAEGTTSNLNRREDLPYHYEARLLFYRGTGIREESFDSGNVWYMSTNENDTAPVPAIRITPERSKHVA